MFRDKTQTDAQLDLSLYIEGLLTVDAEVNDETVSESPAIELVEHEIPSSNIRKDPDQPNIPVWGRRPFDCLTLNISGTRLLIPAAKVDHVECVSDKVTRLPVKNEVMHGILSIRGRSVVIIDLFRLITATTLGDETMHDETTRCSVKHAVVMRDSSYAIASDSIGSMVNLQPESIRWNDSVFNNKYFCGIASEQLCPLLDIVEINCAIRALPFVQALHDQA